MGATTSFTQTTQTTSMGTMGCLPFLKKAALRPDCLSNHGDDQTRLTDDAQEHHVWVQSSFRTYRVPLKTGDEPETRGHMEPIPDPEEEERERRRQERIRQRQIQRARRVQRARSSAGMYAIF